MALGALLLALGTHPGAAAQEASPDDGFDPWFARAGFQAGWVTPTSDFVRGWNQADEPIDRLVSLRAELGFQTDGSRDWHHAYNLPSYGIGVFHAAYGNRRELGDPWAVYGFFSWPILVSETGLEVTTDFGMGVAFGWEGYDRKTNPYNRAIGGSRSLYLDWGFLVRYPLAERWDLAAGYSLTHFSNGRIRSPNTGINTLAPMALVRYRAWEERPGRLARSSPGGDHEGSWQLSLRAFRSRKEIEIYTEDRQLRRGDRRASFEVHGINATVHYERRPTSRLAFGIDYSWDRSADAELRNAGGRAEVAYGDPEARALLGLFVGYERVIDRLSLVVDVGRYVLHRREDGDVPPWYQRVGARYRLFGDLFGGMFVRLKEFGRADYVEWTVGYRVK